MHKDYYTLDNGRQIVDYIYTAHLGFSYGNAAKYLCRASRKPGESGESDLNKALTYVLSANEEFSFIQRVALKLYNLLTFNFNDQFSEHHLRDVLCSIIRFDRPTKVARKIVKYAKWRGIPIKEEFSKYDY